MSNQKQLEIPTFDKLMKPLLCALRDLGGSGTIEEIFHKVVEEEQLSDDLVGVLHDPVKGGLSEVEYRLAWTRTYLKKYGLIESSRRGVWALTALGRSNEEIDPKKIVKVVREQDRIKPFPGEKPNENNEPDVNVNWENSLLEIVTNMDPAAFERLIQRMLRESGFIQVEVTGRSGDGGIDGKGIMRLGGLLSFHVIFQCKRYKGSISASQIRDFRGAMVGRADKGLFVTTGSFTKDAIREATRDGANPLDLIDGDQLVGKLKELSLGVRTEVVHTERITVDKEWFHGI